MIDAPLRETLALIVGARPAEGFRGSRLEGALERLGLGVLARFSAVELARECGLTAARGERLAAAFALGRAAERARIGERPSLRRPEDVARLLAPELRGLEVETFHAVVVDARHRFKGRSLVSRGTLTSAPVHPREVFVPALRLAGAAVIVAHNHPSGDPEPSAEDVAVTARLVEAGRVVGVPLLDHVVVGGERWVSLRQRGLWPQSS